MPEATLIGLSKLGDEDLFPAAAFEQAVEGAALLTLGKKSTGKLLKAAPDLVAVAGEHSKSSMAALSSLFLEAAKYNAEASELGSVLDEAQLEGARAKAVGAAYAKHRAELRQQLLSTAFSYPQIVDVQWRLDQRARTKQLQRVGDNRFLISIVTAGGVLSEGERSTVEFVCTKEELQDLVGKLKDATKQVDRLLDK